MRITHCRICGQKFFQEPLLAYKNMPARAQYLPEKKSLRKDKGISLQLWQCGGCGLVQLNSRPVAYYKEAIRAAAVSPEMRDFRRKQFGNFVRKYSLAGKKMIEIGCGRGEYLSLLQQCGIKAYGLEALGKSVRHCQKKGLRVSKGFIQSENEKLNNSPFNAFFILSFLEHLPQPKVALRGIANNLTEGGLGLVEVPNFEMILKKRLFAEFMRDHLFYFTKETLATALTLSGFELVDCQATWHDYILSATVKKRKKIDFSIFSKQEKKLKKETLKYLKNFKKEEIAIWGAGHQAMALISILGLAAKVKYVIDSAPFKQGKYTPASRLPIVSPAVFGSDKIEAVIIMAAGYSDEVAGIIRKKHDRKINIAILRNYGLEIVK